MFIGSKIPVYWFCLNVIFQTAVIARDKPSDLFTFISCISSLVAVASMNKSIKAMLL